MHAFTVDDVKRKHINRFTTSSYGLYTLYSSFVMRALHKWHIQLNYIKEFVLCDVRYPLLCDFLSHVPTQSAWKEGCS